MSATKDERTVLLYKICSLQRKKLNLLYEDCGAYTKTMEQTLRDYGVMVGGVWTRGLKKYCGAFNSVVLTW